MAKKTTGPRPKKKTIDPFDYALVTGGPLPAKISTLRACQSRIEDPDQPGLMAHLAPPLRQVWQQFHGKPMTPADAAAIAARWPEVEAHPYRVGSPEARLKALERQYESARIDALPPPAAHPPLSAEDEQRRAEAEAEAARLAGEIAELRAQMNIPGPAASNWPEDQTRGFQPAARLEQDDDE